MKLQPFEYAKEHTVLSIVTGPTAYGIAVEGSDVDMRHIYIPSPGQLLGASPLQDDFVREPEQWLSVTKFVNMLRLGKPNYVELLFGDKQFVTYNLGSLNKLFEQREMFLTKELVRNGVSMARGLAQRAIRMDREDANPDKRYKSAMHAFRVMLGMTGICDTGDYSVYVPDIRDTLVRIREKTYGLDTIEIVLENSANKVLNALDTLTLPESVDPEKVDAIVVPAILSYWETTQTCR